MFLEHYQLREQPFGVTPDPRFLYMSETHREALAALFYGVHQGQEFLALVAPPGMGKTSLLFRMMQNLDQTARSVFLFQTQCNSNEFLGYLLADMGLAANERDQQGMRAQLQQAWQQNAAQGRKVVLVIDEAQGLDDTVLETVSSLADDACRGTLQVVLAGQPQLARKLAAPGMARLSKRISMSTSLRGFDAGETRAYVEHRVRVAGGVGDKLFTVSAMELIARYSQGIPRNINNICFNALSWGYAEKLSVIDANTIEEVGKDLDLASLAASAAPESIEVIAPVKISARAPQAPVMPATLRTQPGGDRPGPAAAIIQTTAAQTRAAQHAPTLVPVAKAPTARLPGWLAVAAGILLVVTLAYGWYGRQRTSVASLVGRTQSSSAVLAAAPDRGLATSAPVAQGAALIAAPVAEATDSSSPARNVAAGMRTVVVQPQQTISALCRLYLGRDDAGTLREISELNKLPNPNHIEVGQRLILPRQSSATGQPGTDQDSQSAIKRRDRE
jgi:type II secretory pathway predicted ATPase ExeA